MSSTNRGALRSEHDYYVTPQEDIVHFLKEWMRTDHMAYDTLTYSGTRFLDPCAGGNMQPVQWLFKEGKGGKAPVIFDMPPTPASYPAALQKVLGDGANITSIDIRRNSPAQFNRDYLNDPLPMDGPPDVIISNPPFNLALDFIRHSLVMVRDGGYVVMLLRLNFFGSAKRKAFFENHLPTATYVHHERMGFTPDGKTDSIEYMHAVWQKGTKASSCALRVI